MSSPSRSEFLIGAAGRARRIRERLARQGGGHRYAAVAVRTSALERATGRALRLGLTSEANRGTPMRIKARVEPCWSCKQVGQWKLVPKGRFNCAACSSDPFGGDEEPTIPKGAP